jgi:hypothetical protein
MRRITLVFCTIILCLMSITSAANAHTGSGWSTWRGVDWHDDYVLVHHKHVDTGTVCELYDKFGNEIRFKLISKNANNHDCTG